MKTQGIFRVSASSLAVENYKEAIDSGSPVEFNIHHVHLVANLLKLYFRELPDPLIPYGLYDDFAAVGRSILCVLLTLVASDQEIENRAEKYKTLLKTKVPDNSILIYHIISRTKLTSLYIRVLKALVDCLRKVASFSTFNLMTASNIGLVFEPNILKKKVSLAPDSVKSLTDVFTPVGFLDVCIERYDTIFSDL
jgi:hypothetical protein